MRHRSSKHLVRRRESPRLVWVLAAAVSGWSCGDEDPPPQQAVIWLAFSSAAGSTCSSAQSFQFPEGIAQGIVTGSSGVGPEGMDDRIRDEGDDLVSCSLQGAGAAGSYNVAMTFSNLARGVGNLEISGSSLVQGQMAAITLRFRTSAFELSTSAPMAQECMARVKTLNPDGAIWLDNLSCPNLRDQSSPGISCVGSGGLIFENCG